MASILIGIFTLILVIVCILLVLVILMQRPNANAGMGAALGGGAAEGMFGGEAGNVLTKATVRLTILFFVISAGLYLAYLWTTGGSKIEEPQTLSLTAVAGDAKADAKKPDAAKGAAKDASKQAAGAADAAKAESAKQPAPSAPAQGAK